MSATLGAKSVEDLPEANRQIKRPEATEDSPDCCQNPWNPICKSSEIELYIFYEDRKTPICRLCWQEIAESDREW